jgi:hypothetical protein
MIGMMPAGARMQVMVYNGVEFDLGVGVVAVVQ